MNDLSLKTIQGLAFDCVKSETMRSVCDLGIELKE